MFSESLFYPVFWHDKIFRLFLLKLYYQLCVTSSSLKFNFGFYLDSMFLQNVGNHPLDYSESYHYEVPTQTSRVQKQILMSVSTVCC
jgi:hypothetical protein